MPNIATQIAEDLTKHGIDLARLEAGTSRRVIGVINNLAAQLREDLIKSDPTAPARIGYREARSKVLLASTNGKINDAYKEINRVLGKDLKKTALLEADVIADMANSAMTVDLVSGRLSTETLNAIVNESKLFGGENLAQWLGAEKSALKRALKSVVNKNVLIGTPIPQMVRELIGTKANNYKDGIMRISRARANTIVRTSVNAIANNAREQVYANNDDVIKGKQWLATLDTRTSDICISLDGEAWSLDGKKLNGTEHNWRGPPPAHPNCRSLLIPVLKSWSELNKNPAIQRKLERIEKKIRPTTRASMDGEVSAKITYIQWLNRRSKKRQLEVLGPKKYELWKQGQLSLSDLIDQSHRPLTISQLINKVVQEAAVAATKIATQQDLTDFIKLVTARTAKNNSKIASGKMVIGSDKVFLIVNETKKTKKWLINEIRSTEDEVRKLLSGTVTKAPPPPPPKIITLAKVDRRVKPPKLVENTVWTEYDNKQMLTDIKKLRKEIAAKPFIIRNKTVTLAKNTRQHDIYADVQNNKIVEIGMNGKIVPATDDLLKRGFATSKAPVRHITPKSSIKVDSFSSVDVAHQEQLVGMLKKVGTEEADNLIAFIEKRGVKSVMVRESEQTGHIKPNYLPEAVNDFLGSKSGSDNYVWRNKNLYGWTRSDFNHVVVNVDEVIDYSKVDFDLLKSGVGRAVKGGNKNTWSTTNVIRSARIEKLESEGWEEFTKKVQIKEITANFSTWGHEMGHQVHFWAGQPNIPEQFIRGKTIRSAESLTKYSRTNSQEWHAEHFNAWFQNRAALADWNPGIAEYFDDLMQRALASPYKLTARGTPIKSRGQKQ